MNQSEPQRILTEAVYCLKRAFEDKDVDALRECFTANARLNADGKFHTVAQAAEFARILFGAVDQTYFDVLELKKTEAYEGRSFGVFDVAVAWVNRSDWQESAQRLTLSVEVEQTAKDQERARIAALTAARQPDPKQVPQDDGGVPVEVGFGAPPPRFAFDPFSFWY